MSFSPLGLLNALSWRPSGVRRVAHRLAYGEASRQVIDIYAPSGSERLPVVVFFYGGSWEEGDRRDYAFVGRALAAQGVLVAVPDYRVRPEVAYPAFLEDCAAAVRKVAAVAGAFGGDASKLAVMGHSAGAYNAAMVALHPAYAMGVPIGAVVGLSGPYDFYPFDIEITQRTFGHVIAPETTQPVNLVTASAPPMFLASGDRDQLVLPRNTRALAARLRTEGVEVVERHFPKLDHAGTLVELGSLLAFRTTLFAEVSGFLRRQFG